MVCAELYGRVKQGATPFLRLARILLHCPLVEGVRRHPFYPVTMEIYQPTLGDKVQLRKKHPCGSDIWIVVRTGADIGLVCTGCERRILLERPIFRKRVKKVIESGEMRGESGESGTA
jgi:hypothetical protein